MNLNKLVHGEVSELVRDNLPLEYQMCREWEAHNGWCGRRGCIFNSRFDGVPYEERYNLLSQVSGGFDEGDIPCGQVSEVVAPEEAVCGGEAGGEAGGATSLDLAPPALNSRAEVDKRANKRGHGGARKGAGRKCGQADKDKRVRRPGTSFCVTVALDVVESKDVFYEWLHCALGDSLLEYCICVEDYKDSTGKHIHCYLKTEKEYYLDFLRAKFVQRFKDVRTLDLQPCKRSIDWLRYITKEDADPLTNMRSSQFNFYYHLVHFARRSSSSVIDVTDPFVVKNWQKLKLIERFVYEYRLKDQGIPVLRKYDKPFIAFSWAWQVVNWYNRNYENKEVRKNQLYLWGDTNIGKSTLIEEIIRGANVCQPFPSEFGFSGYLPGRTQVILFEEFEWSVWRPFNYILKRIVEGRRVEVNVKGKPPMLIEHRGLVIFVSNENNVSDEALISRLIMVRADCHIKHCSLKGSIKMEEETAGWSSSEGEEDHVIQISSSGEEDCSEMGS